MEVSTFNVDRDEAVKMLRKYREHRAYSTPVDSDIVREEVRGGVRGRLRLASAPFPAPNAHPVRGSGV